MKKLLILLQTKIARNRIMLRLLLPMTAVLIFVLVSLGILFWQQQEGLESEGVAEKVSAVKQDLEMALEQQTASLSLLLQSTTAAPTPSLARLEPVFETLLSEHLLSHFYILDARRACLLCIPAPDQTAGPLDSFLTRQSAETRQPAAGIDLGSRDTLILRVVRPVLVNGNIAGYVETGKGIAEILPDPPPSPWHPICAAHAQRIPHPIPLGG